MFVPSKSIWNIGEQKTIYVSLVRVCLNFITSTAKLKAEFKFDHLKLILAHYCSFVFIDSFSVLLKIDNSCVLLWPQLKSFAKKNMCASLRVNHNSGVLVSLFFLSFALTWHTSWDLLLTERSFFFPPTEAEVRRDRIDCCGPNWTCVELQAATR